MFNCFTLNQTGLHKGIKVNSHECILADDDIDVIINARLHLLPVLPSTSPHIQDRQQLSLAFLAGTDNKHLKCKSGSLVDIDPSFWKQSVDNSPIVLLDPCGPYTTVLLFLPPSCDNLLFGARKFKGMKISTDAKGSPAISPVNRAAASLVAMGIDPKSLEPGSRNRKLPKPVPDLVHPSDVVLKRK